LTPAKKVSQPRPSMARKTMATTTHTRIPITQLSLFLAYSLTIMKKSISILYRRYYVTVRSSHPGKSCYRISLFEIMPLTVI
jgi:hypothetical protein